MLIDPSAQPAVSAETGAPAGPSGDFKANATEMQAKDQTQTEDSMRAPLERAIRRMYERLPTELVRILTSNLRRWERSSTPMPFNSHSSGTDIASIVWSVATKVWADLWDIHIPHLQHFACENDGPKQMWLKKQLEEFSPSTCLFTDNIHLAGASASCLMEHAKARGGWCRVRHGSVEVAGPSMNSNAKKNLGCVQREGESTTGGSFRTALDHTFEHRPAAGAFENWMNINLTFEMVAEYVRGTVGYTGADFVESELQ